MTAFPKRARIETNDCARRRIWTARDRSVRVVESRSLFGLPTVYYVQPLQYADDGTPVWGLASTHRKRIAAFRAAQHLGGTQR